MATPLRSEAPSKTVSLRMSPEEQDKLRRAAESNHQNPTEFARDAIVNAAEAALGEDDENDQAQYGC